VDRKARIQPPRKNAPEITPLVLGTYIGRDIPQDSPAGRSKPRKRWENKLDPIGRIYVGQRIEKPGPPIEGSSQASQNARK